MLLKEELIREIGDEVFGMAEHPDERMARREMEKRLAEKSIDELRKILELVKQNQNYVP